MKHMKLSSVVFSFALLISATLHGSQANILVNTKNNNNVAQPVNQFKHIVADRVKEIAIKDKYDPVFAEALGNKLANNAENLLLAYKAAMAAMSKQVITTDTVKTTKHACIDKGLAASSGFTVSETTVASNHAEEIMDVIIANAPAPKVGRIAQTKAAIAQFGTNWFVKPVAKMGTKVNSYIPAKMRFFGYKTGLVLTTAVFGLLAYRTGAHKHVKIPNSFKFKLSIW